MPCTAWSYSEQKASASPVSIFLLPQVHALRCAIGALSRFGLACTVTLGRAKQVPDKAVTPPFVFCEGRASLCAIQDLDDLALFLSSSGFMLG